MAEEDGRPVGFLLIALQPHDKTGELQGYMADIYVEPAHRGTGVSLRLTAAGEAHCRAHGVRVIRRYIAPANTPSLRHALRDGCRVERLALVKVL